MLLPWPMKKDLKASSGVASCHAKLIARAYVCIFGCGYVAWPSPIPETSASPRREISRIVNKKCSNDTQISFPWRTLPMMTTPDSGVPVSGSERGARAPPSQYDSPYFFCPSEPRQGWMPALLPTSSNGSKQSGQVFLQSIIRYFFGDWDINCAAVASINDQLYYCAMRFETTRESVWIVE